jgi:hypothetical protein
MKNLIPASLVFIIALALFSCSKGSDNTPVNIIGNWRLVSDSSYTTGIGAYGPPSGSKYIGTTADHYDFSSNGDLTIHEDDIMDGAATYTIGTDTFAKLKRLDIKFVNLTYNGSVMTNGSKSLDIKSLDSHNMVLYSALLSPGGAFYETVILRK